MGEGIRVFLVDDHEMAREGLRRMLELEQDIQVVGEAANAGEALLQVEMLTPDVILMDIKMPTLNGLEATRLFKERNVSAEIVILSLHGEYLAQAVEAGAAGYLVKDVKRDELVDAIRRINQGELVLGSSVLNSPEITESALGYLRDLLRGSAKAAQVDVHPPATQPHAKSRAGAPPLSSTASPVLGTRRRNSPGALSNLLSLKESRMRRDPSGRRMPQLFLRSRRHPLPQTREPLRSRSRTTIRATSIRILRHRTSVRSTD